MKNAKNIILLVALAILMLTACTTQPGQQQGNTGNIDGSNYQGPVKTITISASQFQFEPSSLNVNKGDHVVLLVTSSDVTHGIAIPDFGVSQQLPAGQQVKIEFTADKTGQFTFFCNVPCGAGHRQMKGTINIV